MFLQPALGEIEGQAAFAGQYRNFCELLGLQELAELPDYATNAARLENREKLSNLLTEKTLTWAKTDLLAACEARTIRP